jgi:hypothetical protein
LEPFGAQFGEVFDEMSIRLLAEDSSPQPLLKTWPWTECNAQQIQNPEYH